MPNNVARWFDPNSIVVSDDMIKHDFSNCPNVIAENKRVREFFEGKPMPFTNNKPIKKSKKKSKH